MSNADDARVTRFDIDYLRSFITLLVVAHHSFIAYGVYQHFDAEHYLRGAPIVDGQRWIVFDVLILLNDIFFMSLMFFISGLFVYRSLERRGLAGFLRERLVRLGLPFVIAVTCLMPIAYYPSYLLTGARIGLTDFWWQTLTRGPWPGGPAWFLWVLYAFAALAALLYRFAPKLLDVTAEVARIGRQQPARVFWLFAGVTLVVYVPMLSAFGPDRWFAKGPFAVQASRVLLYAAFFVGGMGTGMRGLGGGLLAKDGALARSWMRWVLASTAVFAFVVAVNLARVHKIIEWPSRVWDVSYALLFAPTVVLLSFAVLAVFVRFVWRRSSIWDGLSKHAYAIYVVHYVFVIWLQYGLLAWDAPAWVKGVVVLGGALGLSWLLAGMIRPRR